MNEDRMPGDAEAAGAIAAMQEQRYIPNIGWHAGDLLMFVWPEAGFEHPTAARVEQVMPNGSLVVETLVEKIGAAISPSCVTRRL